MPVLREDVMTRLRRLTALNNSRQQSIEDTRQLTEGPFEVQADNGTIMQVGPEQDQSGSPRYRIATSTLNTYTFEDGRCNCPDFINTGSCVHAQAVELVHTGSTNPERPETVTEDEIAQSSPLANNARIRETERERRKRRTRFEAWQRRYGDDLMLSGDDEAFNKLFSAVKSGTAIKYEYENVLAGSENTFGVEIEFVDGNLG